MGSRTESLALRLEQGAAELAELASHLTDEQWQSRVKDGRRIGVVVHHVATMYPTEIHLALELAQGRPVTKVVWDDIHALNAKHAAEFDGVTKTQALALLAVNSAKAAEAIRALDDEQLDHANTVSLNADAPLTCQFFLEDHAVRHSYWHLAAIRRALQIELVGAEA